MTLTLEQLQKLYKEASRLDLVYQYSDGAQWRAEQAARDANYRQMRELAKEIERRKAQ